MRFRKVVVGVGFVFFWSFVTYYFLQRKVYQLSEASNRVQKLQFDALKEHQKNVKLMHKLHHILKVQYPYLKAGEEENRIEGEVVEASNKGFIQSLPSLFSPILNEKSNTILSLQKPPSELEKSASTLQNQEEEADIKLISGEVRMPNDEPIIPILVLACNRISIADCLNNLLKYRPNRKQFPIIVSQDCGDEETRNVILSYRKQVVLIEQPDQSEIKVKPLEKKFKGYYKIARHYGWALNYTFHLGYEYVVIVEDDLTVAPDFFEYFLGTYKLLELDPTLWCVSAWNDNGKANLIDSTQHQLLYRTDFFPGLGWMLSKNLWNELSVKWPKS